MLGAHCQYNLTALNMLSNDPIKATACQVFLSTPLRFMSESVFEKLKNPKNYLPIKQWILDNNIKDDKIKSVFKNPKEISQLEKRIEEIENSLTLLSAELENLYAAQKNHNDTRSLVQKINDLKLELDVAYKKLEKLI